jgi:uncharacterized protein YukE
VLHGLALILLAGLSFLLWEAWKSCQELRQIGQEQREVMEGLSKNADEMGRAFTTSAEGKIQESKETLDTAVAKLNGVTAPDGRLSQVVRDIARAKQDFDILISQGPQKELDRQKDLLAKSTTQVVDAWNRDVRIANYEKSLKALESRLESLQQHLAVLSQQLKREARDETVVAVVFHTTKFDAQRVGKALHEILTRDTYRTSYVNYRLYLTLAANGKAQELLRLQDLEDGRLAIKDFIFGDPDRSASEDVARLNPGDILHQTDTLSRPLFRFVIFASADAVPPKLTDSNWENIQVYAFLIDESRTTRQRAKENLDDWQKFCKRPLRASPGSQAPVVDRRGEAWLLQWPTSGDKAEDGKQWQECREDLEEHLRWAIRPLRAVAAVKK